jgi:hypothetical protein
MNPNYFTKHHAPAHHAKDLAEARSLQETARTDQIHI